MTKIIQAKVYTITQETKAENFNGTWNDTTTIDTYAKAFIDNFNATQTQKVKHIAIILHNMDKRLIHGKWELKPEHFHCYVEFDKRVSLPNVASVAGVEPQYVEPLGKGRYAKENTLAYLVHAKQPEKFQYSEYEVYCEDADEASEGRWKNGWYQDYYDNHQEQWANQLATGRKQQRKLSLDKVLEDILDGKLSMNQVLLTDDIYKLYSQNINKFKDAFQARAERQSVRIAKLITNGDTKVEAYYVWGESGIGKTYMFNRIQKNMKNKDDKTPNWFTASADHPFDNYAGEQYILLDDVGAKALSVKDWLHLLDPHNNYEFGAARYHNKQIAAHTIVITSTQSPEDYFNQLLEIASGSEPIEQVFRRLWSIIHIENADDKVVAEIERHPKDDDINFQKTLTLDIDDARKWLEYHFENKQKGINQKLENQQNEDDKN